VSELVRLLALNVGILLVGVLLLLAAGLPRRRSHVPTLVGVAPAAGLALVGLSATLGAMIGVDVGVASAAMLALLPLVAVGLLRRAGWRPAAPPSRASGRLGRFVELVALLCLAGLSVAIVRLAAATGLDQWDGWAIWGAKAHGLYEGGDLWSPVFTEPEYFMQHQEYPVLLPALEALSADALGRFDPTLIDVEAAVVVVAFGWAAWGLLRLAVPPAVAAGAALALTGSAPLAANAGANYADAVVASFTALGILCLFLWLTRDGAVVLVLAGLFLAAAALTKSEGLIFALAGVVTAVALARRFGRSLTTAFALAASVLVLPGLWAVVDRLNGPGARNLDAAAVLDPGYVADSAERIPKAADAMLGELVEGWPVVVLAVVAALAATCLARLWLAGLFVALWSALSFMALVLVYFVSTSPIDWHLGTSADRVVFSIALGAGTVAPVLAALAWETRTRSLP